jgi:hypothetical protein
MRSFPRVALFEQTFPSKRIDSLDQEILQSLSSLHEDPAHFSGKRIAIAVGSRGIARINEIVQCLVAFLLQQGADPAIVPSMGSHGGATGEGQRKVLNSFGITRESMGVPILSSLDVEDLGLTEEGIPVKIDRTAWESDGIFLVNRIKPHTDFKGKIGSGLMKMIAVGLGNREGAIDFHSSIQHIPHEKTILSKAKFVLTSGKRIWGLAILEDANHELAKIEAIPREQILRREQDLFQESQELMPSLPVKKLDFLIIDRIGKDISGTGMDPNVTGRWFRLNSRWQETPDIGRILVRDLSEKTHGNGLGIGLADFCTERAVRRINRSLTYTNAVTSQNTVTANIPLYFESDRAMLDAAVDSLGLNKDPSRIRMIRIQDTLHLGRFWASEALLEELNSYPRIRSISDKRNLLFDSNGDLLDDEVTVCQ